MRVWLGSICSWLLCGPVVVAFECMNCDNELMVFRFGARSVPCRIHYLLFITAAGVMMTIDRGLAPLVAVSDGAVRRDPS
jgi:hypothetical protein